MCFDGRIVGGAGRVTWVTAYEANVMHYSPFRDAESRCRQHFVAAFRRRQSINKTWGLLLLRAASHFAGADQIWSWKTATDNAFMFRSRRRRCCCIFIWGEAALWWVNEWVLFNAPTDIVWVILEAERHRGSGVIGYFWWSERDFRVLNNSIVTLLQKNATHSTYPYENVNVGVNRTPKRHFLSQCKKNSWVPRYDNESDTGISCQEKKH